MASALRAVRASAWMCQTSVASSFVKTARRAASETTSPHRTAPSTNAMQTRAFRASARPPAFGILVRAASLTGVGHSGWCCWRRHREMTMCRARARCRRSPPADGLILKPGRVADDIVVSSQGELRYGLDNRSGNLGEPSDIDRPGDCARYRQPGPYRDPRQQTTGGTTEPGKADRTGSGVADSPRVTRLAWIIGLTRPLFELFARPVSWRDIVLIAGGLFLLYKGTREIHHALEGDGLKEEEPENRRASFVGVVTQIMLLDVVFSLDSVITAVGWPTRCG